MPIIHILHRQGDKIIAACNACHGQEKEERNSSGERLRPASSPLKMLLFWLTTHTTGAHRLLIASTGNKVGLSRKRVCNVLHTGMSRVTPRQVRLYSLRGRLSVSPGLLRLCCAASVYLSGDVGAGRNAHHCSSFSCITMPHSWACRCVASSCFVRLNVTRGRL